METSKIEIIFAIIFGVTAGIIGVLFITGTFTKIPFSFSFFSAPASFTSPLPAHLTLSPTSAFLTLDALANDTFSTPSATVSGKTNPSSSVIISSEQEDLIVTSSPTGEFKQRISLLPGSNQIVVFILDSSEKELTKELNLYYFPND